MSERIGEWRIHPYANSFPLSHDEEYARMRDDIQQHGLKEPIALLDNMVVDGRNRLRACVELGIEPEFMDVGFDHSDEAKAWVWSTNACRRHLPKGQMAACYVRLYPERVETAKAAAAERKAAAGVQGKKGGRGNKKPSPPDGGKGLEPEPKKQPAAADMAKEAGTSTRTMERTLAVAAADPELLNRVADGDVTVAKAYSETRGDHLPEEPRSRRRRKGAALLSKADGWLGNYQSDIADADWSRTSRSEIARIATSFRHTAKMLEEGTG